MYDYLSNFHKHIHLNRDHRQSFGRKNVNWLFVLIPKRAPVEILRHKPKRLRSDNPSMVPYGTCGNDR